MKIEYQEYNIQKVFRYFVEGFKFKGGQTLHDWDASYDPMKGKVIFKMYINDEGKKSK